VTDLILVSPKLSKYRPSWVAPPLGLLSIAGVLRHAGYSVEVIDLNLPEVGTDTIIAASGPGTVIGISSFTPNFSAALETAVAVKRGVSGVVIIVGGYHVTFCYAEALTPGSPFDAAVLGAGEDPTLRIVESVKTGKSLDGIPGVAFRRNGAIEITLPEPPTPHPGVYPARDLVDLPTYLRMGSGFAGSVQFSRGCTHNCYFCQVPKMEGRWVPREPQDVAAEVREFVQSTGLTNLTFVDNHLTGDKELVRELCWLLKEIPGLHWSCDARIDAVDEGLLALMYEAGCRGLFIGLESGNSASLERIGKPPDREFVRRQVATIRRVGLQANGSFIVGFPWETEADIRQTISFAADLPLSWREFSFATPLPGSRLERDLSRWGAEIADSDYRHWDGQHAVMRLPNLSRRRLAELYLEAIATVCDKPAPDSGKVVTAHD